MTDRYRGYTSPGRSTTYSNPARTSLPSSIGYTSLYAGDMHVMPTSTRQQPVTTTPRGYVTTTSSGIPSTTTRHYAVTQDPRSQRPTTRDVTRSHRSSTLDSTARPPVIVMTTQKDRPNGTPVHSSHPRPSSPPWDDYRTSETSYYTQPASSIRSSSRNTSRPFGDQVATDDYTRTRDLSRDRANLARDDPYRSSRHSTIYANNPRQASAAIDYGDDGYQYTNAGELVRYDLDHSGPSHSRRRESLDRGYYRPNLGLSADQRPFNVDSSSDPNRNYIVTNSTVSNTSRPYDNRGGPPPSTRGFDKISSRPYDTSRDAPPALSLPSDSAIASAEAPVVTTAAESRRPRPVSLYQEGPPRSSHHDDYYRSREDERNVRENRDQHEPDRSFEVEPAYGNPYYDESVTSRGFGIRTDLADDDRRDRRRDQRIEEPKKRSDEDLPRGPDYEPHARSRSRLESRDARRERRESKKGSDEDEKERSRFRDKMAAGLGIAATAVGLAPSIKEKEKEKEKDKEEEKRDKEVRRRKGSDDEREKRRESVSGDRPRVSERERSRIREPERDAREPSRRDVDSRRAGEAVVTASDSDDAKKPSRRHRNSNAFNPNDATELRQLKDQLAALNTTEKEKDRPAVVEAPVRSSSLTRESKPSRDARDARDARDVRDTRDTRDTRDRDARDVRDVRDSKPNQDYRSPPDSKPSTPPGEIRAGRNAVVTPPEEKGRQVRVVSPPRDKKDEKPLRGILKQPKSSFPEEPNPTREGVAPHKEDKKINEAPAGAKWTKVSRKVVNPEALTIGKERFEVRDDFVIVLRVLSKEEIQAYASATQVLRERRRREEDGDGDRDRDRERDRDRDHERERERDRDRDRDEDEKRRHHRHRRHRDDDEADRDDKDRDRERRRRHRDDDDYESRPKDSDHHYHHRSHRDRDVPLEA